VVRDIIDQESVIIMLSHNPDVNIQLRGDTRVRLGLDIPMEVRSGYRSFIGRHGSPVQRNIRVHQASSERQNVVGPL